jgi:hypothetical protein
MIDAAGQDIYGVRRFGKMPEELDAENTEGDDDENFQRNCTPIYPSAPTSTKGSRSPLDALAAQAT